MSDAKARRLVDKLWSYCDVLRDDGVSTIEYVEQLTMLLFLKMDDERATRSMGAEVRIVPEQYAWPRLAALSGVPLEQAYRETLEHLGQGKRETMLGTIFHRAQNRIQDPAKLRQLIHDLIGREDWSGLDADVKGDAYEQLLSRGAEDIKSGAGQYFTPRPLIKAIVECVQPTIADTVLDPAAGTGGFLLAAHNFVKPGASGMSTKQRTHLRDTFVRGVELVPGTARLAMMNLLLHGIGQPDKPSLIEDRDSLPQPSKQTYSVIITNPPFGRKSSITTIREDGKAEREETAISRSDFITTTANKQLNFIQHIAATLKVGGRAAVVLPDNVLFEGGSGETIRRHLLKSFDVHTLLRLPTGIFYAQGVKANVLFFDKKPAGDAPWTTKLWVYDLRTNMRFTLKQNALRYEHLNPFVEAYCPGDRGARQESERFKPYAYEDLIARDKCNLDISWLRNDSLDDLENLPEPAVIARQIVEDLTAALAEFEAVAGALEEADAPRVVTQRAGR